MAIARGRRADWVRLTQAQFAPTEIDARLLDRADLARAAGAGARSVIRLDPGHGVRHRHPSDDAACACAGSRARRDAAARWPRVLDYGCGSGILAIGAALLGARDDRRRRHRPGRGRGDARRTRSANGVGAARRRCPTPRGRYGLVLANILADAAQAARAAAVRASRRRRRPGPRRHPRAPGRRHWRRPIAPWLALDVADARRRLDPDDRPRRAAAAHGMISR